MTDNDMGIKTLVDDNVLVYDNEITIADLYAQLVHQSTQIDELLNIFRWVGKYEYTDDTVSAHTERKEYVFKFPVRSFTISANQQISIQIHDIGNTPIQVSTTEMPFVMSDMVPNMTLRKIYITTGSFDTRIKIFVMG